MKKLLFLLILSFFWSFSCRKKENLIGLENTCSVSNPAQDLPWLTHKIEFILASQDSSYFFVQQANYRGQTVFLFKDCCPYCDTQLLAYNCQGEVICQLYYGECSDRDEFKNVKTIAKAKDCLCKL
jgi:hypothetical protein